jgi:phage portal protein BeeE
MGLPEQRHSTTLPLSLDDWINQFSFNGNIYGIKQTLSGGQETMDANFEGIIQGAYRDNGIVFACMLARYSLFSEARFQFQRWVNGVPGEPFGSPELALLEKPWTNGSTRDLLTKMMLHADIAGNAYVLRRNGRLTVLRPDWMTVVAGSPSDDVEAIDTELVGYLYHPGGRYSGKQPIPLVPGEVAHWAPSPDPGAKFVGMSWITPVIREILGDKAATSHKLRFFENGATPNMVVKLDISDLAKFNAWIEAFEKNHKGATNAYKTLYLGAGADTTVVGTNFQQLDFKVVQGAGETRIAAAAGVPPIIVGLSEGLQAATYSNYGQARRRFADLTMYPLWGSAASALDDIISSPAGAELAVVTRHIPFLAEDVKDAVEAQGVESRTIRTLTDAGFTADSVIRAVKASDWNLLVHSGLFSVQLQPPGSSTPPEANQVGRSLAALVAPYLKERTDDAA